MLHHPEIDKVCPNCGHHATLNYCAQCGQETHLHKETFWGLIMHFIGHYFHFDSKLWQTIRILVMRPGQLTIAYWNKQRARYISPISLYIFISTIYFVVSIMLMPATVKNAREIISKSHEKSAIISGSKDTVSKAAIRDSVKHDANWVLVFNKNPEVVLEAAEKANHNTPKVFFFLVPFFALLLKLVFIKRKDLYFVDHAIFSLHFHSLGFIVYVFSVIVNAIPGASFYTVLSSLITQAIFYIYAVLAIEKVYDISTGRAMWYALVTGVLYVLVYLSAMVVMMAYYLKDAVLVAA